MNGLVNSPSDEGNDSYALTNEQVFQKTIRKSILCANIGSSESSLAFLGNYTLLSRKAPSLHIALIYVSVFDWKR
jgi:hypothetical protein